MRRKQRCYPHTLFYLAATAFGIGLIIGLICSFRLAAISASLLLIIMGIRLLTRQR
ncbi:MAG: hypothetical protein IJF27_02300 [Oscillospiraceae bacterium]|nr:hypothetical protein [Oscillospiraceae bacterium]MBQ3049936.1 hypothetical protein [Oscillospiraceae bacterium]MBQ9938294.1 hypothetical protein [Oscillospiraceae bacterium]